MRDEENKSVSVLGAVLFGAIMGAAAVFLSREENRRKLRDSMNNMWNEGEQTLHDMRDKMEDMKDKGKKKIAKSLDSASKSLDADEEPDKLP